jgi:hypothetical protein
VSELRELLSSSLHSAGMLIDDARFDQTRLEAAALASRHFRSAVYSIGAGDPGVVAKSVGLSRGAMSRLFGHGWQQTAGLAAVANVRENRIRPVARLGALFNLGIVVFDHLLDSFPERRATLLEHLTPALLRNPPSDAPISSGDVGIDFVAELAVEVAAGAQGLDGRPDDGERFAMLLDQMYQAERASTELRRSAAPGPEVWDALRAKSTLPSTAAALLALLGVPSANETTRAVVERAAALIGEAFWIVDDLVDIESDWDAGCWSRPLWLLSRRNAAPPTNGAQAVQLLLETGLAATEAQRLSRLLAELAALSGVSQRTLLRPVQASVRSWIEEIPDGEPT